MPEFIVGAARCESYDPESVGRALSLAVERAGGLPDIKSREVLVKANLLSPCPPEKAVTTHPEVLRAVVGEIRKNKSDAEICIADNPGYIFTNTKNLHKVTGIEPLAEIEGVALDALSGRGVREVFRKDFHVLSSARIAMRYLDAEYAVNAAKLKTHVETEMSGCIKNIFGTSDTATRKKAHRSVSARHLADAISDLFMIRPPEFNVLDAIVGMEGDGPSHGRPKALGWIFASRNALAVDWAGAAVMGYDDPSDILLIKAASERNLGPASFGDINLVGTSWSDLPSRGFRKSSGAVRLLPTFLRGIAHNLVSLKPMLNREECVRCRICEDVCPVDAIKQGEELYPVIDRRACVRCLCCHEMCPTGAMRVQKNIIAGIGSRLRGER